MTVWQALHCAKTEVALAFTREVEMTMPGIVTRLDTCKECAATRLYEKASCRFYSREPWDATPRYTRGLRA